MKSGTFYKIKGRKTEKGWNPAGAQKEFKYMTHAVNYFILSAFILIISIYSLAPERFVNGHPFKLFIEFIMGANAILFIARIIYYYASTQRIYEKIKVRVSKE